MSELSAAASGLERHWCVEVPARLETIAQTWCCDPIQFCLKAARETVWAAVCSSHLFEKTQVSGGVCGGMGGI